MSAPYQFDPANLPSNALALIRLIRGGNMATDEVLQLAGSIIGEIGVLIGGGLQLQPVALEGRDLESLMADVDQLQACFTGDADPNFDITPFIPIIIEIIKIILERRRG